MSDIILFAHPTLGVLGILAAVWVFVEALNASDANRTRTRSAAWVVAFCMLCAGGLGGDWYLARYASDQALIPGGPWPFAQTIVMPAKQNLFFLLLVLALYLPIATAANLAANRGARTLVLVVAGLIVISGLAIEGAGAVVAHGARLALAHRGAAP